MYYSRSLTWAFHSPRFRTFQIQHGLQHQTLHRPRRHVLCKDGSHPIVNNSNYDQFKKLRNFPLSSFCYLRPPISHKQILQTWTRQARSQSVTVVRSSFERVESPIPNFTNFIHTHNALNPLTQYDPADPNLIFGVVK